MGNKNPNITSSVSDDNLLTSVTDKVFQDIRAKMIFKIPSNWDFELGDKSITFKSIREAAKKKGMSIKTICTYFGQDCRIECDCHIIYLTIKNNDNDIVKFPLFIGEMKKQGTNDRRIEEGLSRQSIGNAGPDRVAKNFYIAATYCYLCDDTFFPYNVFLHGCDFAENEITKTLKSKLEPLFGKLNTFNPYFDKNIPWERKGGCCYYQGEAFSYEQLYDYCFKCCECGIEHYRERFGE